MKIKIETFAEKIKKDIIDMYKNTYPDMPKNIIERDSKVTIKKGRKYTKIDIGNSGRYMIDQDENIFGIKAYGVIHLGHHYGTLDTIHNYYWGNYTAILIHNQKG